MAGPHHGDEMPGRVFFLLFLLAASVAAGIAQADERWTLSAEGATAFSLRAPGWVLSFDSRAAPPAAFPGETGELPASRSFRLRLSSAPALRGEWWRLPLTDSAYLHFEATFVEVELHPMPPGWARPALQAQFGLGVRF
jgi:hypothetical protein